MLKSIPGLASTGAATAVALAVAAGAAGAAETNLRIQTHFSQETLSGQMAGEFIEDISAMSNGEIKVEMFYSSAVVKSAETFDAAATGILDCDMTGGSYQTGKNPAFQFAGDLMGGYLNPYQQMAWLIHGGGYEQLNDLYNAHGMEFIGWWIPGPESALLDPPDPQHRGLQELEVPISAGDGDPGLQEPGRIADRDGLQRDLHGAGVGHHRRRGRGQPDEQRRSRPLRHRRAHELPRASTPCRRTTSPAARTSGTRCPRITRRSSRSPCRRWPCATRPPTRSTTRERRRSFARRASTSTNGLRKSWPSTADAVQKGWTEFATTPEAKALLESHIGFLKALGAMK